MTLRVLFVCTGNICRSPTAEAVFRALAEREGVGGSIEAESAGTGDWHVGEVPDPRARTAAAARGYDLEPLRASQLSAADFERFDLLIAMDRTHLRALERLRPDGARGRVRLFLDRDVPDPYYGETTDFEEALDLIEDGARRLLIEMMRGLKE
jgi:low molecular weight protein-tyrosine phosphatase